ncbi:hypothetical protein [Paludisphaera mucosa]|uniref:Uncharacterized protein n=1 Tax=Paludisphaera mucosa TaxID=3030827 RepID=A0ABT6FLQ7_9BACT|nr:hypothetical protein [Paludisphaera mucosa]MDG3008497.1 hypothetical protein [Paludisphaera mucosa]
MSVAAEIIEVGRESWRLVVENQGPGVARSIIVTFDGEPARGHAGWAAGQPAFSPLAEGTSDSHDLIWALGTEWPTTVGVSWIDAQDRAFGRIMGRADR